VHPNATIQARLISLLNALPSEPDAAGIASAARAFLKLVVHAALNQPTAEPVTNDPTTCPNCGATCNSRLSPYCGPHCRESSAFIRQFRASLMTDAIFLPEKQIAFAQIVWHLMGGGLPYRNSLIPQRTMERFFEKHGGKCSACGGKATTVDHIKTFCNRPINLRPMCEPCAVTKPFGDSTVMATGATVLAELAQRMGSEMPLRCCDDPVVWNWRQFLKERHQK
jgi:hypothetical protein